MPRARLTLNRPSWLVTILFLVIPAGAVHAGGTGTYEPLPLKDHDEELISTSREFGEQVERRGYLYRDAEMEALVRRVGESLAPPPTDSYLQYRFLIFRDPLPNAFALPDGQVYVNTGMLAVLENEAQLAMLLAHEINHSAGHHSIQSFRSTRKKLITGTVVSSVAGIGLGDYGALGQLLTSYVVVTSIIGYGRDLEEEADRLGIQRAFDAGYNVREGARMFEILNRDPEGLHVQVPTKWSSHPHLLDRAVYLRERAAELDRQRDLDSLRTGPEFRTVARDVSRLTVRDLVHADFPRTAVDLARRLSEKTPADARTWLALGDALLALGPRAATLAGDEMTDREKRARQRDLATLTRDERDRQERERVLAASMLGRNMQNARLAYRHALELDPDLAEAHRGIGMSLLQIGQHREAGKALAAYLKARPHASDRKVILGHLKTITSELSRAGQGRPERTTGDPEEPKLEPEESRDSQGNRGDQGNRENLDNPENRENQENQENREADP